MAFRVLGRKVRFAERTLGQHSQVGVESSLPLIFLSGTAIQSTTPPSAPNRSRISVAIGSGTDKEYTPLLFLKGVQSDERLKVYATWFDHVEVNSSYHAMPRLAWVENWVKKTPDGFLFDFKLHKSFSEDPESSARGGTLVSQLLTITQPLLDAGKLGAFFSHHAPEIWSQGTPAGRARRIG